MNGNPSEIELPDESAEDLYENAPCGYLSTTPSGLIAKANLTLLNWLGYRRDEIVGQKRFVDLLTVQSRAFHESQYGPLLQMQGFANEMAMDLVGRHGHTVPVLLNSVQKFRPDRSVFFTRTTIFNAESRRSYERELLMERRKAEQAAKAKASFLAAASHEIRNHLHSIAAITELFVAGKTGPHHARYTQLLSTSSSGLLNLVSDVLDYSKLEAGKLALDERPFNVRELVNGVARSLRGRVEIKRLTMRVDIDPRVPDSLVGDAIKLAQVLTNLAGNAVKFTEHGLVTLSVRVRELGPGTVRLTFSVGDTGIGLDAEQMAAVTGQIEQANARPGAQAADNGLGLIISQRLLELYGAKMRVSSLHGRGSIFSFELELGVTAQAGASEGQHREQEALGLRGLRVLVAEDAEIDALLLTHLLERWGVEVELVSSGATAVERVKTRDYDLVLMDLQLSELDGLNATRAIRKLDDTIGQALPIIALASSVELGQRDRLQGAGFTDCLGKPFESDTLLRSVSLHASIHRALRTSSSCSRAAPRASTPPGAKSAKRPS